MARAYSLVCWGGRTGKTAAISNASPCVVTIANHGIRQYNGGTTPMTMGMQLTTTGALPTGLSTATTYWARFINANTFHLYDSEANALNTGSSTGQISTSSAGSGTHTARGAYYLGLSSAELARYGASGSERIFAHILDWRDNRYSNTGTYDQEILELAEPYDDYHPSNTDAMWLDMPCAGCVIAPEVDGIMTPAFHDGIVGAGYRFMCRYTNAWWGAIFVVMYNVEVYGFAVSTSGSHGVTFDVPGARIRRMIFSATDTGTASCGIINAVYIMVSHCIFINYYRGAQLYSWLNGYRILNCIFAKSRQNGVYAPDNDVFGFIYNNIVVGSITANWSRAVPSEMEGATNNASDSGTPWATSGGTTMSIATTDFLDYANNDFRPAAKASPQIAAGIPLVGVDALDVRSKIVPAMISITHTLAYDNEADGPFVAWELLSWGTGGTAGTGRLVTLTDAGTTGSMGIHLISGVAPANDIEIAGGTSEATCDVNGTVTVGEEWVLSPSWSVGAFEHDYGGPQGAYSITLQNVADGSIYQIYNTTTSTEVATGTQSGTGDIVIPDLPYMGNPDILRIRIRKSTAAPLYRWYLNYATITGDNLNIYVSQVPDE